MNDSITAVAASPASIARRAGISVPHRFLLGGLALLLAAAIGLQFWTSPEAPAGKRDAPLAEYFPRDMAGWHSEDRPPAETEAEIVRTKKLLNYDETILRFYRKGSQEFSLYVSYWRAGKMPAREIAFHVPDQCWVSSGWTQRAANRSFQREFEGRLLAPAQYREFEGGAGRQYVIYWHILNGSPIVYSDDGTHSQLTTLNALFRHGLSHKGEQYFIRIASPGPLDDLWADEGFQELMELIAPLGPGLNSSVERMEGA